MIAGIGIQGRKENMMAMARDRNMKERQRDIKTIKCKIK